MQKFAKEYTKDEFLQEVLAKLSWNHNQILLDKIKNKKERIWYATKSLENGWSTTVLSHQISLKLYDRQALLENKTENYSKTLPTDISDIYISFLFYTKVVDNNRYCTRLIDSSNF